MTILYCYWGRQTFEKWEHEFVVINPETIFSKVAISPEKYIKILDALSVPVKPLKKHPNLKSPSEWRKEIYEQFELRLKPLIKIDKVYLCSDIEFIKSAFWDGPYHMILSDYPQSSTAKKMMNFLGDTTEFFVRALGRDAYKNRFVDINNKLGNPMGDGVITISNDWMVIVESKAARPGIGMVSGDKPITELSDFKKLLKDGLTQISERISEYRTYDGYKGRVTPCLITAVYIPQHDWIWELVEKEIGELSLFNDSNTDFPFVMDLEAWNVLCAAEKAGVSISDILTSRYQNRASKTSNAGHFLFKMIFSDHSRQEPPHMELLGLFEDKVQVLTTELFQNIFKERKTTPDSWRSIFEL